ncbi:MULTISPECIES: sterol desaturase family protein [unclassified Wenzhouxiangella]|uniref:sterol desaturase family protein n=1 Tax=unclassified Wenzhouxiangella TaxID=2613841 RepID=UPI000E326608|nr:MULTISPECIES: sterol desaturase family protein [unclassified Wenzhouxiangella]RFF28383.1 sterol desaturase family protein [Wenzhouxiangella sp. 15181]RFP69899.1 sterol desaturase family protein [Wenzhouxiangella sp. 15190]
MNELLSQEPIVRIGAFASIFGLMAVWEVLAPRRQRRVRKGYRWFNNLGVVVLNAALVRVLFPAAAVGTALFVETQGWGLLQLLDTPYWLTIVITVLVLDFAIWAQHVFFHAVPLLWRLHRMHHADLDFDVTTGLRFHPVEILLSMFIKAGVIVMLGAPALAVLIFEVLLNATSMFNHGNVRLPKPLDRILRWIVVTPEMHRVHHSWYPNETNSNFGFNLPWWDRIFGTYRAQPRDGHIAMTIGINLFRDPRELRLDRMLWQPFHGPTHSYPINARGRDDTGVETD